jgi:hypothetical protein
MFKQRFRLTSKLSKYIILLFLFSVNCLYADVYKVFFTGSEVMENSLKIDSVTPIGESLI